MSESTDFNNDIAIIGMVGRFPGAKNLADFWQNLHQGIESVSFFSRDELLEAGLTPALIDHPDYVPAKAVLADIELFDASFFGYSEKEAEIMDPQHRLFLEYAWMALETSGYTSDQFEGAIGVYAGCNLSSYLLFNLYTHSDLLATVGAMRLRMGNDKDFLTTRVSHKLNLTGPSVAVQTACSTSLVAVHLACQSLIYGECDIALAGGVSITLPNKQGHLYQKGGIVSSDGHCRPFSAEAEGIVVGDGIGLVVLKPLAQAIADRDTVLAVIKSSAINNDGSNKVGYTAPSIEQQAEVIAEAIALSGVDPETITYIEAHGTATPLGDPIEVAALTKAFRVYTEKTGFCALGSVKSNIGHLDPAAGIAGLIKTVLALRHGVLPPSLHYIQANPKILFDQTPFFVNTEATEWINDGILRRAGVSSFGIGGTNAHVVLEEAPQMAAALPSSAWHLLALSAPNETALAQMSINLAQHLQQNSALNLADVAYTLQVGRKAFSHRQIMVCRNVVDAVDALQDLSDNGRSWQTKITSPTPSIVFLFPGQGAQYINMGRMLYQSEPVFREQIDTCASLLHPHLGLDLRTILYPSEGRTQATQQALQQTELAQPALFTISYALARLWLSWGLQPDAMIGHSIGEYVAACVAGVLPLQTALALVAKRGQLMQQTLAGGMVSVRASAQEVTDWLTPNLTIAVVNSPMACVVAGPLAELETLVAQLDQQGISYRRLHTSHAFHSAHMDPILPAFVTSLQQVTFFPPQIPYISNVTGTWISTEEATDPAYWGQHLRQTVQFHQGVMTLAQQTTRVFLECGPLQTTPFVEQQTQTGQHIALSSLPQANDNTPEQAFILRTIGRLWATGVELPLHLYEPGQVGRVPLPTYPFDRKSYWIAPKWLHQTETTPIKPKVAILPANERFYVPSWQYVPQIPNQEPQQATEGAWLFFIDAVGIGKAVGAQLRQAGQRVIWVEEGAAFQVLDDETYRVNRQHVDDYKQLLRHVPKIQGVVHLWGVGNETDVSTTEPIARQQYQQPGFYSLLCLNQALSHTYATQALTVVVITNQVYAVMGHELLSPAKATVVGPCRVMPQEYPYWHCLHVDIDLPARDSFRWQQLCGALRDQVLTNVGNRVIAYRQGKCWEQTVTAVTLPPDPKTKLRQHGVYLITGGLGKVGLALASYLAQAVQARLILTGRTGLPAKDTWPHMLENANTPEQVKQQIQKVQALEAMGSEVVVLAADVSQKDQMQRVIAEIETQWGVLHGVIHAAGITQGPSLWPLQELEVSACELQFQPKLRGLLTLAEVSEEKVQDFVLLVSSLSTFVGGVGLAAYAAANAFMDAFAQKQGQTNALWTAVNWDGWVSENTDPMKSEELKQLWKILHHQIGSQIIIAKHHLPTQLNQWMAHAPDAPSMTVAEPTSSGSGTSKTAQMVIEILQELMGGSQIGLHNNFFEMGGDSLIALQLINRIKAQWPIELTLTDLFATPTVAHIAHQIDKAQPQQAMAPVSIPPLIKEGPIPLSFAQQQLWILSNLKVGHAYNMPTAIEVNGSLDSVILQNCLTIVLKRHEILRTIFVEHEGEPAQIILPELAPPLFKLNWQHLPAAVQETKLTTLLQTEAHHPFQLDKEPLWRVVCVQLAGNRYVLLVTMHHIISDLWSFGLFFQELVQSYEALRAGKELLLPTLPLQYANFALWQRQILQGEYLASLTNYWEKQLSPPLTTLALPTDYPRAVQQTFVGARHTLYLTPDLSASLKELSQQKGVTLVTLLLTAYNILLHQYTGQEDILIGLIVSNRPAIELESLIGLFTNTLVLRTNVSHNPSLDELLTRVKSVVTKGLANQNMPFEQLVQIINPNRDLAHNPLFQAAFTFRNIPTPHLHLPDLRMTALEGEVNTARFDLHLNMNDTPQGIQAMLDYNVDLFKSTTIQKMLTHFEAILIQMGHNMAIPLADLIQSQSYATTTRKVDEAETFNF